MASLRMSHRSDLTLSNSPSANAGVVNSSNANMLFVTASLFANVLENIGPYHASLSRRPDPPRTIARLRPGDAASRSFWFSAMRLRTIASNSTTAARGSPSQSAMMSSMVWSSPL